jgi:hypothetical protein
MNEVNDILRSMASNFARLADEIERRDSEQMGKIAYLKCEVNRNKETLRKVANVIIGELGD